MGIFYTVFYAAMMLGPAVGGAFAKWTGSAAAAFDFGAAVLLACPCCCGGSTGSGAATAGRVMPTLHATAANTSLTLSALGSS